MLFVIMPGKQWVGGILSHAHYPEGKKTGGERRGPVKSQKNNPVVQTEPLDKGDMGKWFGPSKNPRGDKTVESKGN